MEKKDILFLGSCLIYGTKYKDSSLSELPIERACEDAAKIYGEMPTFIKYAKELFEAEEKRHQ